MKPDIFYLLYLGYFVHLCNADDGNKNIHNKINVPEQIQKSTYKHTIYKKSPGAYEDKYRSEPEKNNNKEKERVIVHNHGNKFIYDPDHTHDNQKRPANKKKFDYENEYDDSDFKHYLENFKEKSNKLYNADDTNSIPVYYDDGFKTSKTVHTEHFEVKETNPEAKSPDEKYIIRGGYKVQETDPFDSTKKRQHLHTYDSPLSKIAAAIYSHYDYINFPHTSEKDDYLESEENEKKQEDENHEHFEYFPRSEKNHDYSHNKKKTDNANDYENIKSDDKDRSYNDHNFDYFSSPSQESAEVRDSDYHHDKDWEKYILQQVYGDYYSPSNKFVQKALPERKA